MRKLLHLGSTRMSPRLCICNASMFILDRCDRALLLRDSTGFMLIDSFLHLSVPRRLCASCYRYLTWRHWSLILLPSLAVALHMVVHSPVKHLGLDSAVYIGLPGTAHLFSHASNSYFSCFTWCEAMAKRWQSRAALCHWLQEPDALQK